MANTDQLAKRIWELFAQPTPPQREAYIKKMGVPDDDEQRNQMLFSPFNPAHRKRAAAIINKWNAMVAANGRSEDQLINAVLDDFEALRAQEDPDLLYYCLEVFITHYKGSEFDIPSIFVREPALVAPSKAEDDFTAEVAVGSAAETKLDWFREDPLLNEHHAHWHVVYNPGLEYDRQGEMFFYMHQQMLARYDAERVNADVERVIPFSDMRQPISVGYTAGPDERLSGIYRRDRPVNRRVMEWQAQQQVAKRQAIARDIDNGMYDLDPATNDPLVQETDAINKLGSTIEANDHPQSISTPYREYHGQGHMDISGINTGVMRSTVTAIRDVIFWEWHKEVDTHYERLQDRFDPYDFSEDAPPVLMRNGSNDDGQPDSMDVILCFSKDIPGFDNEDFDGHGLAKSAFGNGSWNKDFANGSFTFSHGGRQQTIQTTDTLLTTMNFGSVQYDLEGQQRQYDYTYLNHEPFSYFIRVENTSATQKPVTVRIFLAPESHMNDRSMWIEMDKFLHELMPNSKTVIFRSDTESSVIRKPAVTDPSSYAVDYNPLTRVNDREAGRCRCGWPYHLLVPKGKAVEDGAAYKLVVMMSDGEIDAIESERDCGSLSFCGATGDRYPDKRPLGYPFNRKFNGNGNAIINTVTTQNNFACRSIKILHTL